MKFEPTLESVRQHQVPDWYQDAKLGIFIHWGLYSVPAWAPHDGDIDQQVNEKGWQGMFANNPYSEWYLNTYRVGDTPTRRYHEATYGENFSYDDFAPLFNEAVERWNPDEWGDLLAEAGVKYAVFLTKHHDGFLLFPSRHPTPYKTGYQTRRDIPAELRQTLTRRGIHMGLYYSGGLDWSFKHVVIKNQATLFECVPQSPDYVAHADAHWRELIERYEPLVLWNDIAYPRATNLLKLFADYYNAIPDGVINDRFAQEPPRFDPTTEEILAPPPGAFYDFRTPEYTAYKRIVDFKWEATRGLGCSFSYNQNEGEAHTLPAATLIHTLVDVVSKNGNLLLSLGPMADGTVPPEQRDRFLQIGAWLKVHGEAIYGTRPWVQAETTTAHGEEVRFTQKDDAVYATVLADVQGEVTLRDAPLESLSAVHLLGYDTLLPWTRDGRQISLMLPFGLTPAPARTLRLAR